MAYSFQPLDQALESLGFSYVDGVQVKVASKYCLDCDLSEVSSLLSAPAPSVLSFDSNYDISLERRVLEDIEKRARDEELRKLERQKRIEKYETDKAEELSRRQKEAEEKALEDERRRLQEIEDEKKARLAEEERLLEETAQRKKQEDEEEWRRFEEERLEESRRESCDRSEDDSVAAEFQTPPQEPQPQPPPAEVSESSQETPQPPPGQILVKGAPSQNQNFNPQKINFSDFEAISDPFADLELKSINDIAELQTILSHNNYSKPSAAFPSQQQPPQGGASGGQTSTYYPSLPAQQTPSQALASRLAQTGHNFNPNYVNYSTFSSNNYNPGGATAYNQYCPQYSQYGQPAALPPATPATTQDQSKARSLSSDRRTTEKLKDSSSEPSGSEELKPSRSLGDMISELQKEAEEHQQQKRKSPGSRPGSRGPTGLENWTPWPQLEPQTEATLTNGGGRAREDTSCLADLPPEQASLCRQLQEMGFPLSRLATGCRAVGPDSQKLINFCLVVDRLVDEGFSVEASEEVAALHNAQEETCRKHLISFQQLAEIGFPSKEVHQALIATSFDHQAALEQLIR